MDNKTYILQKDTPNTKAGDEFYYKTNDFMGRGEGYTNKDGMFWCKLIVENTPEWFKLKEHKVDGYDSLKTGLMSQQIMYWMGYRDGTKYGNIDKKYSQSEVDAIRKESAVSFAKWIYDGKWWHPENIKANKVISIDTMYNLFNPSLNPNINKPLSDSIPTLERQMEFQLPKDFTDSVPSLFRVKSENVPQIEKPKYKQMWNRHSGIHNEQVLCEANGCVEYNPLSKEHTKEDFSKHTLQVGDIYAGCEIVEVYLSGNKLNIITKNK